MKALECAGDQSIKRSLFLFGDDGIRVIIHHPSSIIHRTALHRPTVTASNDAIHRHPT
jgi:hypothetical protein